MSNYSMIRDIDDKRLEKDKLDEYRIRLDEINAGKREYKKALGNILKRISPKLQSYYIYNCIEGVLDNTKFSSLIIHPFKDDFYKQMVNGEIGSTCITFVLDEDIFIDKELKDQILSIVDIAIKSFERLGITTELYRRIGLIGIKYKGNLDKWKRRDKIISYLFAEGVDGCGLSLEESSRFLYRDYKEEEVSELCVFMKRLFLKQQRYNEENKIIIHMSGINKSLKVLHSAKRYHIRYEHLEVSRDRDLQIDLEDVFCKLLIRVFKLGIK